MKDIKPGDDITLAGKVICVNGDEIAIRVNNNKVYMINAEDVNTHRPKVQEVEKNV